MSDSKDHLARDRRAWEEILRNEIIPQGLRSGRIRLLNAREISAAPCLVASGAPRNSTGTHASKEYPGGRKAWIQAFECWFKKMSYDSLIGTLRRPYQHAARLDVKLPKYKDLPARKVEADDVRILSWPEHYGFTVWRRPAAELSREDWENLARLLAAEIKYRKAKGSYNPYEDADASSPIERIRDWEAVVDLSREAVLKSSAPWNRRNWIKCVSKAIWKVNRLSEPRARVVTESGKWKPLPDIAIPAPSPFSNQAAIHTEIENAFQDGVRRYEENRGERLDRVIREDENIVLWWENLCLMSQSELDEQSQKVGELWKTAENEVREHHGIPRIGEGWVSEVALLNLIRNTFPHETVVHHARPEWLGRQHLDIFLPDRNVAIEYQGEQHFVPVDFFGGWEGLYETQKRDRRKLELCAQNGVKLVYFRFDEPIARDVVEGRIEGASEGRISHPHSRPTRA